MPSYFPEGTYPGIITRTSGLSHYMRLGETGGQYTGDDGDSLTGTKVNVTTDGGSAIAGESNPSKYFNGSNSYISFGNNVQLVGAFSMEIWVYPTIARASTFLSKENYDNYSGWSWWFTASMIPTFTRLHGGRADVKGIVVGTNQWTQLVVTYDGSEIRQYQNGVLRWDQPDSVGMYTSSYPTLMGCMTDYNPVVYADWFPGYLDEWSTYTRALSAQEVSDHYNRALTPPLYTYSWSDPGGYMYSSESRDSVEAIVTPLNDNGIIRSTEEQGIHISTNHTDSGTVGAVESFNAVVEFAGIKVSLSDARTLSVTETRTATGFNTLADGSDLSTVVQTSLYSVASLSDAGTVSATQQIAIQDMLNVVQFYPQVVTRQRGFMHIAAQRLFNGIIHVQYKHVTLVKKGEPTVSYFLVLSSTGQPLALGQMTTTWETGVILINMFQNMNDYLSILKTFGYFSAIQG